MDETDQPLEPLASEIVGPESWLMFLIFFFFFGGYMFLMWKFFRMWLRTPKELAGIRTALERIADQLEKRD